MKVLGHVTENEMIATFLMAEIASTRFEKSIRDALSKLNVGEEIIFHPNLNSQEENKTRKELLKLHRHYGEGTELFEGFPNDARWIRVELTKDELLNVRYMQYSFWNELTGGTRRVEDALENIRSNKMPYGKSNEKYLTATERLKSGIKFPEIILVAEKEEGPYVALEGHLRLSAYGLAPDYIPEPFTAIVGVSPHMSQWDGW